MRRSGSGESGGGRWFPVLLKIVRVRVESYQESRDWERVVVRRKNQ